MPPKNWRSTPRTRASIRAEKAHATRAFKLFELAEARLLKMGWKHQRQGVWTKRYANGEACTVLK